MKMKFSLLRLHCKGGIVDVDLAHTVTYFWGQTSVGKSTIAKLIDYCLAGDLLETAAIKQELVKTELFSEIEANEVVFQREKGSNQVLTLYRMRGTDSWHPVLAPLNPVPGISIINEKPGIESLSDLIFFLSENAPPRVRRIREADRSALVRLSFRDLLWYCHLKQEQMDSTFFYLDREQEYYRQQKSQTVLRLILGFHQERVAELEDRLSSITRERRALIDSSNNMEAMVGETDIGSAENIRTEINGLNSQLAILETQITQAGQQVDNTLTHPIDELRKKAKDLSSQISEIRTTIRRYDYKIIEEGKLFYEFETAGVKVKRVRSANEVLKGYPFQSCPQCAAPLSNRSLTPDQCPVCTQPYDATTERLNLNVIEAGFNKKRKEIQDFVQGLKNEKHVIEIRLRELDKEKELIDDQIDSAQKSYNSRYLETVLNLERERSRIKGRNEELARVLSLLSKIDEYKSRHDLLASEEESVKRELREARADAEMDKTSICELEDLFLESLVRSKFPDFDEKHYIKIDTKDFLPRILNRDNPLYETEYGTLGSGGKKTLFKACFAIAVHRLAIRKNIRLLPSFLIIDGPMKNLSKNENPEIYQGFYEHVYELSSKELRKLQIIIIDSDFVKPGPIEHDELDLKDVHMKADDPQHPRLIPWYKE